MILSGLWKRNDSAAVPERGRKSLERVGCHQPCDIGKVTRRLYIGIVKAGRRLPFQEREKCVMGLTVVAGGPDLLDLVQDRTRSCGLVAGDEGNREGRFAGRPSTGSASEGAIRNPAAWNQVVRQIENLQEAGREAGLAASRRADKDGRADLDMGSERDVPKDVVDHVCSHTGTPPSTLREPP